MLKPIYPPHFALRNNLTCFENNIVNEIATVVLICPDPQLFDRKRIFYDVYTWLHVKLVTATP